MSIASSAYPEGTGTDLQVEEGFLETGHGDDQLDVSAGGLAGGDGVVGVRLQAHGIVGGAALESRSGKTFKAAGCMDVILVRRTPGLGGFPAICCYSFTA